jgi:hypothetical protein
MIPLLLQSVLEEAMHLYPTDTFVKCENAILAAIKYNCLISCPSEILKLLLFVANQEYDFREVI